jgi:hypothetical protein
VIEMLGSNINQKNPQVMSQGILKDVLCEIIFYHQHSA